MKYIYFIIFGLLVIILNACEQTNNEQPAKINNEISFNIEEVLKMDTTYKAIMLLDEYLNKISNYGKDIEKLTNEQMVVLFVENLEREVNNGGFHQFFLNSSGDYAMETLDGLKQIGANKTAMIYSRALSPWPDNNVPKNTGHRRELLEEIEGKGNPIWSKCDDDFYKYEDNITDLLFEYVKKNKDKFK